MVAPVEEAPTKVVKVATTVARRPSAKSEETKVTTPAAMDDNMAVLEESFRSTQSGYEGRSADVFRFFYSLSTMEGCFSTKIKSQKFSLVKVASIVLFILTIDHTD